MTPEQQSVVRSTWAAIGPHTDAVIALFYAHLFRLDPATREMFAEVDLTAQRRKFLDMIEALVHAVEDPASVVTATIPAARRHATLDVSVRQLEAGRDALLHALADTLGERFTAQARQAWRDLYGLVAAVMRRASARASSGATR
jgi:hemoglobin-like flavoprotein